MAIDTKITLGHSYKDTSSLYRQVANSEVVDNVFIFSDGTNKYRIIDDRGPYIARAAGVIPGGDVTSRLQTVLNHASVKEVVIDGGDITISGTIDCGGKKLTFRNNAKFIGTATIDDVIIDADYQSQIFADTISLTNAKIATSMFSVKWYGAVGNNATDDQPAIQKAIDTIVANETLGKDLFFPEGTYAIGFPLIVYKWGGSDYEFTAVNLIGGEASHFSNTLPEVIIRAAFTDKFAIGFQRVKSCKIRGLYIQGAYAPTWDLTTTAGKLAYLEGDYATWASQWGVRDSRYSPYAAIVIDPFKMDAGSQFPPDGGYPDMEDWYRGNTNGGSTAVIGEELRIDSFTVAIMVSPTAQVLNGECLIFDRISIHNCKVGWASSQRQEKGNRFTNVISWGNVHTMLDTNTYGGQQGNAPYCDGWNIANNTVRLFNIENLQHSVTIKNIYAEFLYRIGVLQGGESQISLENLYVDFLGYLPIVPSEHCSAQNVKFDCCNILYYDDLFDKRLCFKGAHNTFISCRFAKLPYFIDQLESQLSSNYYINCKADISIIGAPYYKGAIASRQVSLIPCGPMRIENARVNQSDTILEWYLEINAGEPIQYINIPISGFAFSLDETTRIGTFTTTLWWLVSIDDYVIAFNLDTNQYQSLGRVSNVNTSTGVITVIEVPQGVDDTDQFFTGYLPKIKKVRAGFLFDLPLASVDLNNVDTDSWGGMKDDITGEYLDAIEGVMVDTDTIVGTSSITGNNLYSPNYGRPGDDSCIEYIVASMTPDTYAATFPTSLLLMKPNTIWIRKANNGSATTIKYRFTTPGYLNAAGAGKTRQAVWQVVEVTGIAITQLTGDVTAGPGSGSQAATIAANAVSNTKLRQSAGLSVIGRSANSTGDVADISAANDHEVLRRSGTSMGFGTINLASSGAVGSSILTAANGGTGLSAFTEYAPLFGGTTTTGALQQTGVGTAGQVLTSNGAGAVATFQTLSLNGTTTHDFGTLGNNSSATTNITVTGAADGDYVLVTKPAASGWSNGEVYAAWVSATNTVTVRQSNHSGGSAGFGSQTINVKVIKQ